MERKDFTTLRSIRGIGAVMIFIHHFGFNEMWATSFGDYAVSVFFMLSGVVLALAYGPDAAHTSNLDTRSFLRSRIIKIYPIYLLSLIAAATVKKISLKALPFDLLLLQSWIPIESFYFSGNSVSWFLSSLLFCYAMFCPLMRAYNADRRRFLLKFLIGMALYVGIVLIVPEKTVKFIYIFPLMQFPAFILGMLAGMTFHEHQEFKLNLTATSWLQVVVIGVVVVQILYYPHVDPRWSLASYWWPVDFALLYLMLVSERQDTPLNRFLRLKPVQIFGNVSFVFYLFHTSIIRLYRNLMEYLGINLPIFPSCIIAITLTFAVSWVLHYYVEIPVSTKLKSTFGSKAKGF